MGVRRKSRVDPTRTRIVKIKRKEYKTLVVESLGKISCTLPQSDQVYYTLEAYNYSINGIRNIFIYRYLLLLK